MMTIFEKDGVDSHTLEDGILYLPIVGIDMQTRNQTRQTTLHAAAAAAA